MQKRQIFREQVLPALGGKIPEEAFRTDRLALNRLNKEGITIVDGVILEARNVEKHPTDIRSMPELIKVYATSDERYVPPEGRYDQRKTVDTTYVIRMPIDNNENNKKQIVNNYQKPISYEIQQPKAHTFVNFYPIDPSVKPKIYKPIFSPLTLPASEILVGKPYYQSSWTVPYDWENSHTLLDNFYYKNNNDFNTHQIIGNYDEFLYNFHDRLSRHITSDDNHNIDKKNNLKNSYERLESTEPTKIPLTKFSCEGKTGTFADVETKCTVFHECSGWSKTSSLCPVGTAYSEITKRCDWSNTVSCNLLEQLQLDQFNVKHCAVMANKSFNKNICLITIIIVGFTIVIGQNHQNFRINIQDAAYVDYDEQNYQPIVAQKKPILISKKPNKNEQDFSKIPGIPGIDFPLYHQVPQTTFSCSKVPFVPGMYANVETGCQAYHTCHDGREGEQGASFLCSNGTLFNQKIFSCDWWYNVNCADAPRLYSLNGDLETNPFVPNDRKEAIRRQRLLNSQLKK
ncbi:hypothetical protein HCN44_008227 [Aphidius gifuensis]|uniref:Chitin-binding type-2 domain-containing protein n=1 Tax=Aphidius gifuensis TaxID=684658 RepID=A0A835CPW1_APHGI|nr:hypothetical protein HCN44_008227 [Aphidius gifuensis]